MSASKIIKLEGHRSKGFRWSNGVDIFEHPSSHRDVCIPISLMLPWPWVSLTGMFAYSYLRMVLECFCVSCRLHAFAHTCFNVYNMLNRTFLLIILVNVSMKLFSVPLGYLKNTLKENELDAWDWPEEDCRENEWCIWCRAQGAFRLYNHNHYMFGNLFIPL